MDYRLVNKCIPFVDEISNIHQYDNNIKHLLYLIVPAFVTKYSIYKENLILSVFKRVRIIISDKVSPTVEAYYTSIPYYDDNNIYINKYVVIQNYEKISLVQLMDDLVHEFNHAIHSYEKEKFIRDNTLFLRTGLTYSSYSLTTLSPLGKDDSYVLEEILNTRETEDVINYIKQYNDPNNEDINNTVYSFNKETGDKYSSDSYYFEKALLNPILNSKTFVSTLSNLRLSGDIEDIEGWFDNITGRSHSYADMLIYLNKIMMLEEKISKQKMFRNVIINQIRNLVDKIMDIIFLFQQNCHF